MSVVQFFAEILVTSLASSHLQANPTPGPAHKWIIDINTRKNLWAGWLFNPGGKETPKGFLPTRNPLVFLRRNFGVEPKICVGCQGNEGSRVEWLFRSAAFGGGGSHSFHPG
jgi:hypothetical protein